WGGRERFRSWKRTCGRGAKRPCWSKKKPPLGTCELRRFQACRRADGRNVGATSQGTGSDPFTASVANGRRRNVPRIVATGLAARKEVPGTAASGTRHRALFAATTS